MSQVDRAEMRFSGGDEAPELEGYRPISPLVIMACIAGLMSLLAVVHPLLWIVPVVAVLLSVCAIRQVSAPQSRYSGRLAAVAALCLALLIGAYAPARRISFERTLYGRAQTQAEEWISLVQQGRHQEAHQFTMGPHARFQGPGRLAEHYLPPAPIAQREVNSEAPTSIGELDMMMNPSGRDELTQFVSGPLIAKLVEFGTQGSIAHIQDISIKTKYGNYEVTQQFRVSGVHGAQPESIEFFLTSTRWQTLGNANWQIGGFKEVLE